MSNEVLMLKHHPMNVKFTNKWYTDQTNDDLSEYEIFDVTSRIEYNREFMREHPTFAKDLSPFYIGPVKGEDGSEAQIFEIFWQCGKVYPCHDDNGKPNPEYFKWRDSVFARKDFSKEEKRHPQAALGYDHSDCRYFAYYDDEKKEYVPLDYVEARKLVYFKEYAKLVYNTESFKFLKKEFDEGKKIALVDFDAFNHKFEGAMRKYYQSYLNKCKKNGWTPTLTIDDYLNIKDMKDVLNCKFLAVGHAFVIKLLLEEKLVVENGKVIDKEGLLEIR